MNNPLISVVIPAHNREKTIGYCIQSVLNQTYQNFEILICDDCSTDKTIGVVENFKDKRIKLFKSDKKIGAQEARNTCIRNAEGDFIAFLDSDDEFLPDKLEKQVNILKENDFNKYLFIHSDGIVLNEETGEKTPFNLEKVEGDNCYPIYLEKSAVLFCAVLTSKQALEEIGLLDKNVPSYQEWDTAIRLSKICKVIFMPEASFIYHLHKGETISKNPVRELKGYDYIISKHKKEIKKYTNKTVWRNHLCKQFYKCLNWKFYFKAEWYILRMPLCTKKFDLQKKLIKKIFGYQI